MTDMAKIREKLKNRNIHIISHAHSDYAWTHYRQWHIERYILIINEVLDIMKENPEFTWMMDNENHMLAPFLRYCPHRLEEFKQRAFEGRLEITNGTISLVRSTQVGDETFIRNIILGKRFFKKLLPDMEINVYNNMDVAIGHSQLPQLLKLGGYTGFWGWRPQGALDYKGIPRQFVWKGLDGAPITCIRGFYGGLCRMDYLEKDFDKEWAAIATAFYHNELEKINDNSCVPDLLIVQGMDDSRPLRDYTDKPSKILDFIEAWNQKEDCKLSFITVSGYFNRIAVQPLPEIEGVLDACDVEINTPSKGEKGLWRMRQELDRLLLKAETLWAFAAFYGERYPEARLEELWRMLLGISGHATEFTLDSDFEELYSKALAAKYHAEELIRQAKYLLTMKLTCSDRKQYVIYNTVSWERKEIIPLHIVQPAGGKKYKLADSSGRDVPYQICNTFKGDVPYQGAEFDEMDILAEVTVPGMGYNSLYIVEENVKGKRVDFGLDGVDIDFKIKGASSQTVDTGEIKVIFKEGSIFCVMDKEGRIVYDKKTGRPVPGSIRFTKVRHHEEMAWFFFKHYQGVAHFVPVHYRWEEYGPLRWKYVTEGFAGVQKIRQEIALSKGSKHIDFNTDIECMESRTGFFSAEFPMDNGSKITADIPFGIEERDIANEPYGQLSEDLFENIERYWEGVFTARSWVDYGLGGKRNSLVSENCGHYFMLDEDNESISIILTRVINNEESKDWVRHSHPYNKCAGKHNFKYSLFVHGEDDGLMDVTRFSRELAAKLEPEAVIGGNPEGRYLPDKLSILDIKSESAVVSAFYNEDNRYILRIYEAKGIESKIEVKSAVTMDTVAPVDFNGNIVKRGSVDFSENKSSFSTILKPWEIINLQVCILT